MPGPSSHSLIWATAFLLCNELRDKQTNIPHSWHSLSFPISTCQSSPGDCCWPSKVKMHQQVRKPRLEMEQNQSFHFFGHLIWIHPVMSEHELTLRQSREKKAPFDCKGWGRKKGVYKNEPKYRGRLWKWVFQREKINFIHTHVCAYMYMYVCIYVCILVYVHTETHTRIHTSSLRCQALGNFPQGKGLCQSCPTGKI